MFARTPILLLALLALPPVIAAEPADPPPQVAENSLGMKFVMIPSGEFMMGSDESPDALAAAYPQYERRRFLELGDEAPVHKVRITHAFYLGRHEVTVGQFKRFLDASGYRPESEADGTGGYGYNRDYDPAKSRRGDAFEGRDPRYSWRNPGFQQGDDHHDMHGNAWEWVADWYDEHYYAHSPVNDPQGPADGKVRVRRGGSWHTWSFYARSSYRNWNSPDTRYTLVGMRLLREAD